ncbi:MAG: YhbY family RNA-binding protein [Acidilobaceae archaeon]|nr:YhbY family RNA-binding protein [Acidilobaceae archaeon]MDW7973954.1 YhbY family RNA-binding protein [Sulfolobales archaeon]
MKRAREKAAERADVIVGKRGLEGSVLREIEERFKKQELVKVKMLRTVPELEEGRRELAARIAKALGARLVEVRGRTFILYKPKRAGSPYGSK